MKGLNMVVAQLLAFSVLSLTCPRWTGNHVLSLELFLLTWHDKLTNSFNRMKHAASRNWGTDSLYEVQNIEQCYASHLLRVGSSSSFLTIILSFTASFRRKGMFSSHHASDLWIDIKDDSSDGASCFPVHLDPAGKADHKHHRRKSPQKAVRSYYLRLRAQRREGTASTRFLSETACFLGSDWLSHISSVVKTPKQT